MTDAPRELISVGRFARRTGLTPKALRHYDRIGLFRPAHVDDAGYRWYDPDQLKTARLIRQLRGVDVPLDNVRRCIGDEEAVQDVLLTHQRRLEARLTRVRGDLHRISHLLSDGLETTMTHDSASVTTDVNTDADAERALAKSLFNGVWTLMEQEQRTREDDDQMLHMAHASRFHWGIVGEPEHLARGEWQCSRVYTVLKRAEPATHHAQRALDICVEHGIGDWDLAFAYEALARAAAMGGDAEKARAYTEQALVAAEDIAQDDDRELLLGDLESIPGQPRFW